MKAYVVSAVALLLLGLTGFAVEANGLRLTAQKTVLEKDTQRDNSAYWDHVEKALGLKVAARNVSFKDLPEGTVEYCVIVRRWGHSPALYQSYSGTEKLPALLKGAESNLTIGKVPMKGYESGGNRKQYQDTIEGWQIVAKHSGTETVRITSTSSFDKLLAKAKPGPKVE